MHYLLVKNKTTKWLVIVRVHSCCHVIAHGDEEVRLILFSRGESALSGSQKVTVKRECGSRRGDQVFALSDLRSPDIGRGKREKPNDWLGPKTEVGLPSPQRK